jgi:hypothetical protein
METKQRRNAGRSHYPDAVLDVIIEKVRAGKSVVAICEDKTLPCWRTVYRLLANNPEKQAEYVAAKRQQIEDRFYGVNRCQ